MNDMPQHLFHVLLQKRSFYSLPSITHDLLLIYISVIYYVLLSFDHVHILCNIILSTITAKMSLYLVHFVQSQL